MKLFILAIAVAMSSTSFSFGQNLIINPSAEADPLASGWIEVSAGTDCYSGTNWRIRGNQNGFPVAQSGNYIFFSGCESIPGEIYQDIDVSANAAQIDAGSQIFTFSCYTRSYSQNPPDGAQAFVEYRNNSDVVLSSYNTGVTYNTSGWVNYSDTRTAPVNTRKIRIRLLSSVRTGPSVDGYFDNLSLTTNIPLPVDLINFDAKITSKNTVQLTWQTVSEVNNDYFTVGRSPNGIDWEDLVEILGAGNSSAQIDYHAIDQSPFGGNSYYRLKQTDFDNQHSYSDIRVVNIPKEANVPVSIYPNPTTAQIAIKGNEEEIKTAKMFNNLGQDVTPFIVELGRQNAQIKLDLSNLPTGTYYVKTKTTANVVHKN